MAIISETTRVLTYDTREHSTYQVLDNASVDETASDAVDIRNALAVTLFVESGASVSGGVVKLETAANASGPWFVAGTVTTAAATTGYADSLGGGDAGLPANYARARIETVISNGTVDVYIIVQN